VVNKASFSMVIVDTNCLHKGFVGEEGFFFLMPAKTGNWLL